MGNLKTKKFDQFEDPRPSKFFLSFAETPRKFNMTQMTQRFVPQLEECYHFKWKHEKEPVEVQVTQIKEGGNPHPKSGKLTVTICEVHNVDTCWASSYWVPARLLVPLTKHQHSLRPSLLGMNIARTEL